MSYIEKRQREIGDFQTSEYLMEIDDDRKLQRTASQGSFENPIEGQNFQGKTKSEQAKPLERLVEKLNPHWHANHTSNVIPITSITQHAMGNQLQLGDLYDAKTGRFYPGFRLWDAQLIKKNEEITDNKDTKLKVSLSLEEMRKNCGVDTEGSVKLDFGIFKLGEGSAKYLDYAPINAYEARVDVTCTKTNRSRMIPFHNFIQMPWKREMLKKLPEATHFVQQVSEGAAGNVSILRKCTSKEESKKVSGEILHCLMEKSSQDETEGSTKSKDDRSGNCNIASSTSPKDLQDRLSEEFEKRIEELGLSGKIKWGETSKKEHYTLIGIEGAIEDKFCTLENAWKAALSELPKILQQCNNSLNVTLYPISCVDPKVAVNVRELDEIFLEKLRSTLEEANMKIRMLRELPDYEYLSLFPGLQRQCESFTAIFKRCIKSFEQRVSRSFPKLKDGTLSTAELMSIQKTLDKALLSMQRKIAIADAYLTSKHQEDEKLKSTFQDLESRGFKNFFKENVNTGSVFSEINKIVLNFGGNEIESVVHSKEKELKGELNVDQRLEWFENTGSLIEFGKSLTKLNNMKNHCTSGQYQFGFGAIGEEVIRFGAPRETAKPQFGAIVMISTGEKFLISDYKPEVPRNVKLEYISWYWYWPGIKVTWEISKKQLVPVSSVQIRWRPTNSNENWAEKEIGKDKCSFTEGFKDIYGLKYRIEYDIELTTTDILGIQSSPVLSRKFIKK